MAVSDTLGAVGRRPATTLGKSVTRRRGIPQFGFTGREPDATGLTYFRHAITIRQLGRFTQQDPIGLAGGLESYT